MRTTDRRRVGRVSRAMLAAVTATLAVVTVPATGAVAAGASITGRVVHGAGGGGVPDVQVTLHTFEDGVEAPATSDTTDRNGRFAFSTLVAGAIRSYQVSVRFSGAVYRSRVVQLGEDEAVDLSLKVYETTSATDGLSVVEWNVWIDRVAGDRIAVQHDVRIRNEGDTTYVGTQPVDDGQQVTFRLPIADGAAEFQYLQRFLECCAAVRDGVFVHTLPIEPGTSDGTMRYTAPPPDALVFEVTLPTETFSLLVPADITVEAPGLTSTGELASDGVTYQIYSTSGLGPGDRMRVSLTGLQPDTARTFLAVGIGLLAVVLLGGGAMWWLRAAGDRTRRRARDTRRPHPGNGGRDRSRNGRRDRGEPPPARRRRERTPAARGVRGIGESESLLIDEIVALDVAHEQGLLERDTYRKLRAAAKDRLLALRDGT